MTMIERLGQLSFFELRNGRLFTELGQDVTDELMTALAEQPAQQQEPVAFEIRAFNATQALIKRADVAQEKADVLERGFGGETDVTIVPLYASPPEQQEELQRLRALVRAQQITIEKLEAQQQEPVAWINWCAATGKRSVSFECESELASQPLYEGITQNTQYHYSKFHSWFDSELHRQKYTQDHPAYLAAQEAWNAANDAAQHRINRLNAEIEAWKVRFKIAEDALAKLNGQEQKPVAWVGSLKDPQPHCVTDLKYCSAAQWDTGYHLKYIPLYTSPPAAPASQEEIQRLSALVRAQQITIEKLESQRQWVGLTDEEYSQLHDGFHQQGKLLGWVLDQVEAKLREKNA